MLSLNNINITLGKDTKLQRKILNNLNLTLDSGHFIMVIGGNGAGKSTLFNLISGFLMPDSGTIMLDGQDITHVCQRERSRFVAKVMQDPRVGTMENMTILENMAFALKRGQRRGLVPFSNSSRKKMFRQRLERLDMGLENRMDDRISNLSGGQRQALSLVMAIMRESKILLLDEITAALDPKVSKQIMHLTNTIVREEKRTCIMITHNMADALQYGDRTLLLSNGKFIKEFSANDKQEMTPTKLASEFDEF